MSFTVARRLVPGLPEERYRREFCGPARCASLAEFLATTSTQVALLQKPDALRLLSADVVRRIADEGVVYAELRFAPQRWRQYSTRRFPPRRRPASTLASS
jgi:adenosine deaminase